jgi:hypothetical protein
MHFFKKYICEIVLTINLFLLSPMHDFSIWWNRPVINDAFGYYAYLPAVFIYHDLEYNFMTDIIHRHYPEISYLGDSKDAFVVNFKGREVNKYPPGVAYFQAPFFFLGHLYARAMGLESDGYSKPYMVFLCIGALFWQYVFFKLLKRLFSYYSLSELSFALTVPLLSFGTNVFFYTQMFGTYSHIYSMLSISIFFYGGLRFFNSGNFQTAGKYFFWFCVGFALTVVTRNINGLCILLLPCMGFKFSRLKEYLSYLSTKAAIISLTVSGVILFTMFLFWHIQTGYWLIDSYPTESFDWLHPKILRSLFSVHKGWFFYTPLAALGLTGLFFAPREFKWNAFLLIALVVYINSSWSAWDYGTGFSLRAYIDWYLILGLAMGFLFNAAEIRQFALAGVLSLALLFSGANLLFSVQFLRGIISGSSQGIEYTIKNFFRLRPIMEFMQSKKSIIHSEIVKNDFDNELPDKDTETSEKSPFSKGLDVSFPAFFKASPNFKIRFGSDVLLKDTSNTICICASITSAKDSVLYWHQIPINYFCLLNTWEKVETGFHIPYGLPIQNARLKVFFWEPKGNSVCKIDNMYAEFMKVTND